jgi:hypothetical protein
MADWKKIKKNISDTASKAAKRTGEIADMTVKRVKLASTEAKLEKLYEKLGRLTYKQLKSGEAQTESIAETILGIDRAREEYFARKQELEADKKRKEEAKNQEAAESVKIEVITPDRHIVDDDEDDE